MSASSIGPVASPIWPEKTSALPSLHLEVRYDLGEAVGPSRDASASYKRATACSPRPRLSSVVAEPTGDAGGVDDLASLDIGGDCRFEVADRPLVPSSQVSHLAGLLGERRLFGTLRAERDGLQVGGLGRLEGSDSLGPFPGPGVRLTCLGAQFVGVRVFAGGLVGVEEVGGDDLGNLGTLVGKGRSQVLGRPQVPGLSLGPGQACRRRQT